MFGNNRFLISFDGENVLALRDIDTEWMNFQLTYLHMGVVKELIIKEVS